jgi:hypothetical protein
MIKRLFYLFTIVILSVSLGLALYQPKAQAYSRNKMIEDSIFDNVNSMSESAIRSFINSRPGTCLVNSGAIFPEPKDYFTYGPNNVDAARVVYIAAQAWGLNPQVILTTLQKEQSLMTDNDCYDPQGYPSLPKAMGYFCLEGGQCPPPNYSGFEKQVMKGAWQLKFNKERAEGNLNWDGDQDVHYNTYYTIGNRQDYAGAPSIYHDGYVTIDGVATYLENGATASLYRYTPHYPQTFDTIFSDWFGSPTNVCGADMRDIGTTGTHRAGDYNADGKTEASIYRALDGCWHIRAVGDALFGMNGDIPVPGDYNGDGRADVAIFRSGDWHIRGVGDYNGYGGSGDIPVPGDYNGDGRTDAAIYRPSQLINGEIAWHIRGVGDFAFGHAGDIAVPADYNGDGRTDIAVFRPSTGDWHIRGVGDYNGYGGSGDIPMPADYNGDGRADAAVYRPSQIVGGEVMWHVRGVGDFAFGGSNDVPVPGDYNGDGRAEIAVFRNGDWHIRAFGDYNGYGQGGDYPTVQTMNALLLKRYMLIPSY